MTLLKPLKIEAFLKADGNLLAKTFCHTAAGDDLPFSAYNLNHVKFLGSGGCGMVHCFEADDRLFAVKFFITSAQDEAAGFPSAIKLADQELTIVTHPRLQGGSADGPFARCLGWGELATNNIKRFLNVTVGKYLVYEYCEYGDVTDLIDQLIDFRQWYPEPLVWSALSSVVDAAEQLTKPMSDINGKEIPGILHLDVKLNNLLVSKDARGFPIIKLGDFGIAEAIPSGSLHLLSHQTNPPFTSPEWPRHCAKSQLWSVTHAIYMIATLGAPCRRKDRPARNREQDPFLIRQEFSAAWKQEHPPGGVVIHKLPEIYSKELFQAFQWILAVDRGDRADPTLYKAVLNSLDIKKRAAQPWELLDDILGEKLAWDGMSIDYASSSTVSEDGDKEMDEKVAKYKQLMAKILDEE